MKKLFVTAAVVLAFASASVPTFAAEAAPRINAGSCIGACMEQGSQIGARVCLNRNTVNGTAYECPNEDCPYNGACAEGACGGWGDGVCDGTGRGNGRHDAGRGRGHGRNR